MLVSALCSVLDVGSDEIEPAVELLLGGPGYVTQIIKSSDQGSMIQVLDAGRIERLVF